MIARTFLRLCAHPPSGPLLSITVIVFFLTLLTTASLLLSTRCCCFTSPSLCASDVPPKHPEHLAIKWVRLTVSLGLPVLKVPLDSFLHVFLLLPLPAVTRPLCALVGHPQLDLVVQPAGGEDGQGGVRLEDVDHAVVVARHQFHDPLRLFVPKKDVATI